HDLHIDPGSGEVAVLLRQVQRCIVDSRNDADLDHWLTGRGCRLAERIAAGNARRDPETGQHSGAKTQPLVRWPGSMQPDPPRRQRHRAPHLNSVWHQRMIDAAVSW